MYTRAEDYVSTSPLIKRVAIALCRTEGQDPFKQIPLNTRMIATWSEAKWDQHPIVMHGPQWMLFRRGASQFASVLQVLDLVDKRGRKRLGSIKLKTRPEKRR